MLFTGKQQPVIAGKLFAIRLSRFHTKVKVILHLQWIKVFSAIFLQDRQRNCRISTLRVHFFRRNDQGETDY